MNFRCYIAMTAAEYYITDNLPTHIAWMACHFSCYGTGLSNLPPPLPDGSMLILNDKIPPCGHDPIHIIEQLRKLKESNTFSCLLLDFQRPGIQESQIIAKEISDAMDCPVGITTLYADACIGPVFVTTPKPHQPLKNVIHQWENREIWLEAAIESESVTITEDTSRILPLQHNIALHSATENSDLRCLYKAEAFESHAELTLTRNPEQLELLINDAKQTGVSTVIGLYQQLGSNFMSMQ